MNKQKVRKAVEYFLHHGWTLEHACGIAANLHAESGMRPDAVGDGGMAYGIAQWHPPRQAGFERTFGKPIQGTTFEEQLAWVHAELKGPEHFAGAKLSECTTAAQAGDCVSRFYERPADADGDSRKRAALAMEIFDELSYSVVTELPPHPEMGEVVQPEGETNMGAGLLMALVQTVIGAFAPLAQQKMSQAMTKHGGDPAAATALMEGVLGAISAATGNSVQAMKDDPKVAIQAVSAVQADPTMLQQVETDSLAVLDKLAPVLDRLHTISKEEWAAEEDSRRATFERNKEDPSQNIQKPLMRFTMSLVALVTAFTGGLLGWQMHLKNGEEPNGQLIILFVMLVTTFVNMLRTQNDWGFGSSKSSAAKDETIRQIAKLK
jgi:hypothetical protein